MVDDKILIVAEPDMTCRLRASFVAERPVIKCLTHEESTVDGKYEVMVAINKHHLPVYIRIENIAAIDSVFVKACKKAIPAKDMNSKNEPNWPELDYETAIHVKSFCEESAMKLIELWKNIRPLKEKLNEKA